MNEHRREINRKWQKLNREKQREYKRKSHEKNNEAIKQKSKERYAANKEIILQKNRGYYATNKETYHKYYLLHKKNKFIHARVYAAKMKHDPHFRLARRLRNRLWNAVTSKGIVKSASTMKLVGCTIAELKLHLESQFSIGMTWDNYGEWHIDHKRPCSSFNLIEPDQQCQCFHYTNLQPLWAKDNLAKSASLDWTSERLIA